MAGTVWVLVGPSPQAIFVRYVLFAVVAGLANLGSQELVHRWLGPDSLALPIAVGTVVGFVLKYGLDKRWIFADASEAVADEMRKVVVYGLFSVATTLVFWSVEIAAWTLFGTAEAKYAGGALGLAIGNLAKYHLDKRWVFGGRTP